MQKDEIKSIIVNCLKEYFDSQDMKIKINDNTQLVGRDSVLDSIGLVNVIIDIESVLSDKGIDISLSSAEAMSRRNSPFRNITALADFIAENREEENV